jgi:solute carrier family 25 aspartate/glutamate transporter 12/13
LRAGDATDFPVYSNAKTGINERLKGGKHEWSTPLLAGLLAGVPAATVSCPFDVIKTRMQATMGKTSMRTTAAELWVEGGAPAFFKGVGGRVGRVAPQLAIALFLYDSINAFVINALHVEPPKPEKKKKFGW